MSGRDLLPCRMPMIQSCPTAALLAIAVSLPLIPATSVTGDKLPKGPPWHTEYRSAKRHALRTGTPVFVYFTKTY